MKKNKIKTPEEIEHDKMKDFIDCVAPSIIKAYPTYCMYGNLYRSVWAVTGYALSTTEMALLHELGEKDGVTLKIYVHPISASEESKIITNAERKSNFAKTNAKSLKESIVADDNINDIANLIQKMHQSKEPLLNCAVFIEISGRSQLDLQQKQDEVISILNKNKILYDNLWLQQRDAVLAVNIVGDNRFKEQFERVLPASSVANLFPFSYSGKNDKNGFYIGRDVNGSNIIVNFDARSFDKTNGHILMLGNTGQGKSYLLKLLTVVLRQMKKNFYCMDIDNEYGELTENIGGTQLDMMSGKYMINVLEPKLWTAGNNEKNTEFDEPVAFSKGTRLSQHIAFLRDFFSTYKPFSSQLLDTLEILLTELYKRWHITDETDFSKLKPQDYPILSDLYNLAHDQLKDYNEETSNILFTKENLRELTLGIHSICVGSESVFFNGHTNIPNGSHINFALKDMLSTNENLRTAMYFNVLSYMSNKFLTEGNSVVCCDEVHELLKNTIVISYLRSFVKRGRKKDSNLILASQNVEDFFLPEIVEYTKPFLSIPTHQFLFYPGECDTKDVCKNLNINDSEFSVIAVPNRGHCLYKCGSERYHLHVIAPEYKAKLFGDAGGR